MVILGRNPVGDIRHTADIDRVVINGRMNDGDTLEQLWPDRVPAPDVWWTEQRPEYRAGTAPLGGVPEELRRD